MKYMGSKSRISKYIVPIIQSKIDESQYKIYIEPFCGGCNVIDKIKAPVKVAYDYNPYLISLFNYLKEDGILPESIPRETYSRVRSDKENYPEWYVGAVGFLASYNGRFFDGGYAQSGYEGERFRDYYQESKRNILSQVKDIKDIKFYHSDYKDLVPVDDVIYCDPPYEGTKKYNNSMSFDHIEFWDIMRKWSENNIVLISEENAPDDFTCIWQQEVSRSIKASDKSKSVEKLFIKA